MYAVKFIKELNRSCKMYPDCARCPFEDTKIGCVLAKNIIKGDIEKLVAIVEQWSAEHPQKTMLQDFLEKFPNATLHDNGTPYCCPHDLGYKKRDKCSLDDCVYCWNRPVEEEDE